MNEWLLWSCEQLTRTYLHCLLSRYLIRVLESAKGSDWKQNPTVWGSDLAQLLIFWVALGKGQHVSGPQFSHLWSGDNRTCPLGWLWGWNELEFKIFWYTGTSVSKSQLLLLGVRWSFFTLKKNWVFASSMWRDNFNSGGGNEIQPMSLRTYDSSKKMAAQHDVEFSNQPWSISLFSIGMIRIRIFGVVRNCACFVGELGRRTQPGRLTSVQWVIFPDDSVSGSTALSPGHCGAGQWARPRTDLDPYWSVTLGKWQIFSKPQWSSL